MKTKYGYMVCPTPKCGTRLAVKKNERSTLSWSCQECDNAGYVRKGEAGYARWDDVIVDKVNAPEPDSKPAPKSEPPKPAPAVVPPAAKKSSLFV